MRGLAGNGRNRRVGVVVAASMVITLMAACTDEPAKPQGISDPPGKGGTVRILTAEPGFSSLDPQRIYVTTEANASKLITRTLTTFKSAPGPEGGELVGDLATDTGRPNKDNTAWDFTLRDGIKWDTGQPVTCEDVRYGVLRNFDVRNDESAVITGGPPYPTQWLDVDKDYRGPKSDGTGDVGGVTCTDEKTIHFELNAPVGNFPSAVAMTAFSPVPQDQDTWEDYGEAPQSTGPYKLTKLTSAKGDKEGSAVFERNKHWDSATDKVRKAAADKIIFEFGVDPKYATQQIIADNPEYANAVLFDNIPANYVQQVLNDDQLSSQTVAGLTTTTRYMSINSTTVTDLECRKALVYAFNKRKYLEVVGGEIFGDYATTMLSPDDPGHKDFDVFGMANNPDGDLEKAQELLDAAKDCPKELTVDVADSATAKQYAETVVTTYSRLGITVNVNEIPSADFFDDLTFPDKQHDLVLSAWAPDWPGGSGVLPALYDGDLVKPGLNSNFSLLDDPDINDLIDEATNETDVKTANRLWGELDEAIQRLAVTVPIAFVKVNSLCGKNIRGAFLNGQWSSVDVASLGVAEGT